MRIGIVSLIKTPILALKRHNVKVIKVNILFILVFLFGISVNAFGQTEANNKDKQQWYFGFNGGVNVFFGDVKYNSFWPSSAEKEIKPGGGLYFGRNLGNSFQIGAEINYHSLQGVNADLTENIAFKSTALSMAILGSFNPVAALFNTDSRFGFYLQSGAGIIGWKGLLTDVQTNDTINNFGWTNTNKAFSLFLPVGIKFEFKINSRLSTELSNKFNFVFSDLIDGKSEGKNDHFNYTSLGFKYSIGSQKSTAKLLSYNFSTISIDSSLIAKKEIISKDTIKAELSESTFSIDLIVPETAPHTNFEIFVRILKSRDSANGFFKLNIPSGFIPQASSNTEIKLLKLGYNYEYNFSIPADKDSLLIPIQIRLSEIEKGNYPILIDGEITNQKKQVFPIKLAKYVQIISEADWYKGLSPIEKAKYQENQNKDSKSTSKTYAITEDQKIYGQNSSLPQKQNEEKSKTGIGENDETTSVYRVQIMASTTPHPNLNAFLKKHNITEEVYIANEDGWYRYNIYSTSDRKKANDLCKLVQSENNLPKAFPVYYENGKRMLNPSASATTAKKESVGSPAITPTITIKKENVQNIVVKADESKSITVDNKLLYRVEIAMAFDQPIPVYLLQNKIGHEKISEFKQHNTYYYTIGEFEDLAVARAFLDYTKTQFNLENAKIGQYQNDKRIKGVL